MLISSVWRGIGRIYFIIGLVAGGAGMGLLVALVGSILFQWWIPDTAREEVLVIVIVVVTAASPLLLRLRYMQNRRQVPEAIRNQGPRVGAFQFGFEMGTASRTFMPTTMPHVLLLGLVLLIEVPTALAVGVGFGLGRAAVPLMRSYDDYDLEWTEYFDRWSRTIWLGTSACGLAGLVAVLLADAF